MWGSVAPSRAPSEIAEWLFRKGRHQGRRKAAVLFTYVTERRK
jgi:hypothetical protein